MKEERRSEGITGVPVIQACGQKGYAIANLFRACWQQTENKYGTFSHYLRSSGSAHEGSRRAIMVSAATPLNGKVRLPEHKASTGHIGPYRGINTSYFALVSVVPVP